MSTTVKAANWRLVELGRVILVNGATLATIVEIIDQKRVLIDGPSIQRQAIALAKATLTPIVIPDIQRGSRTGTVKKKWAAADVETKFAETGTAKKAAIRQKRAALSDFERFQVMVLKRERKYAAKKIGAK